MTKRWQIFAVFSILYVLAYFYRVSLAVLARDLTVELGLSAAQLGTLAGIFFYAFAFTQLPLGPLLDRHGGRIVVLASGVVTVIGIMTFANAHGYMAAMAGRVLIGAGSATVLMGALRVFTHWFDQREFGRVSGFAIAVGNLGNLSATAPLAWAVSRWGWRMSFLAVALLQVLCLILLQRSVREHPAGEEAGQEDHTPPPLLDGLRQVIATPSYWFMSGLAFFWYANYMAVQGLWGGPFLMDTAGLSRSGAGFFLLLTSVGFLVGCLLVGRAAETVFRSRKRTMVAGQAAFLITMCPFLLPPGTIPPFLLGIAFFAMGLAVSSGVAIYPLIRERFPLRIIGSALTAVNFFILLGAAVMQQLMGMVIERFPRQGSGYPAEAYRLAFLLPIAGLAVALVLFARFVPDRRIGTE